MSLFAIEYLAFSFVACCGALQVAAWHNHLNGLSFLPRRHLGGLLGAALAVGAFLWFFLSRERNVPDTDEGLGGTLMFALFLLAAGAATAFTLALSSLANWKRFQPPPTDADGLEALRQSSYVSAILASFRKDRLP